MRKLLVMRGFQGVGKSSLLRELGLSDYVLCADDIRNLFSSPELLDQGKWTISHQNEDRVWKFLFERLEERMKSGQFVVIDAMHLLPKSFQDYLKLAQKYYYQIACMDFRHFPIDQALSNNQNRVIHRRIPENIIIECQKKALSFDIPKQIKQILWQNDLSHISALKQWLNLTPISLNQYQKIHHIGDLQGCFDVLQRYLKEGIKSDEYYIFVGDYFDRGMENAELAQWLLKHINHPNIKLLWGNHESIVADDLNGREIDDPYYLAHTRGAFKKAGIEPKDLDLLLSHIDDLLIYEYHGKIVYCTHGGLDAITEQIPLINSNTLYSGVGNFSYDVDLIFESFIQSKGPEYEHYYQIHGHKNAQSYQIDQFKHSFNLEGNVEFGGELRIVTLDTSGFECVEIKNQKYYRIYQRIPTFYSFIPHWTKTTEFKENINQPMQKYLGQKNQFKRLLDAIFPSAFKDQLYDKHTFVLLGLDDQKWKFFDQYGVYQDDLDAMLDDHIANQLIKIDVSLGKQKKLKRELNEFKAYLLIEFHSTKLIAMIDEKIEKFILANELKQYLKNYKWAIFLGKE
jgi:predicted kinase